MTRDYVPVGFYVYVYFDPAGMVPFYVGKGKDYRALKHLYGKGTPNIFLRNKIRKIQANGMQPHIQYLDDLTEDQAHALERSLIEAFGRRDLGAGTLVNYTHGGEGSSGRKDFKHTEETKGRIRASLKGRPLKETHRQKIAASPNRHKFTSTDNAKRIAKQRTPEARAKMAAAIAAIKTRKTSKP